MKKYLLTTMIFTATLGVFANENHKSEKKNSSSYGYRDDNDDNGSGKYKHDKDQYKGKHKDDGHWKYTKNIPTSVAESFYRDYPNAQNPTWTKDKGDWAVAFNNGAYRSTAIYHANGERHNASCGNVNASPTGPTRVNSRNYGGAAPAGPSSVPTPTAPNPRNYGGATPAPATPSKPGPDPKNYGGL